MTLTLLIAVPVPPMGQHTLRPNFCALPVVSIEMQFTIATLLIVNAAVCTTMMPALEKLLEKA